LSQNGFCVDVFKEPVPLEPALGEHPGWGYRMQVPSFVVIRAIYKSPLDILLDQTARLGF
jgi:hypothetical protein